MSTWQEISDWAKAYRVNPDDVPQDALMVTIFRGPVPSPNLVGKVANYLTRDMDLSPDETKHLRGVAIDALRATWEDGAKKDAMISAATRYIRRSFLGANPQDDDHKKRLIRRLLRDWHANGAGA